MTPVRSHTGREEVSEYLSDAYKTSSNQYKAPSSTRMWIQPSQRDKLKRLSSEARTPVLQFLRERPPLRRTLSRDSPHLEEAFQLAVDAIGQANETQQWETLAEILMDACLANPAASIDLHEVLYGVVTPAGQWGFWGQGALKKLVAPISSIAGFGLQAFRNNQPRDFKHPANRSFESSDADDFSIGTARSDSNDSLPPLALPPLSNSNRLPPSMECIKPDSSSDQPSRSEAAFTQQNLQGGDPASASDAVQSVLVPSSAAEESTSHNAEDLSGQAPAANQPPIPANTLVSGSPNTVAQAGLSRAPGNKRRSPAKLAPRLMPSLAAASMPEAQAYSAMGSPLTAESVNGSKASGSKTDNEDQQDAAGETALAQLQARISSRTSAVMPPLHAAPSTHQPLPHLPQDAASTAVAADREGPRRPLTKPLRSKRSADTMADSEVRFPMPSRPRMSLAPPGSDQRRPGRIGRVLDDLPDPNKMTEKELLEFDFSDIERRLEEIANKTREDRIARHGQKHYDEMQAKLPPYLRRDAKLFKEDGTLDEVQAQSLFAAEAQTKKWLADNPHRSRPDTIPSRMDQLKSRVSGALAGSHAGSSSSCSYRDIPGLSQEVLDTLADADSIIEYSKKQNSLLEDLMKPEQRVPYREFKKEMEERAKQQDMGLTPSTVVPKGAIPALESARAALDKFQHERMASIGSVSEPLARAQQQLAELEASLAKPAPSHIEAYQRVVAANRHDIGDNASLIAQAFPDQADTEAQIAEAQRALDACKQSSLNNPYLAEAIRSDPDFYARHSEKVKATLDDWKAGKVPNLSEALKEQITFGPVDVPGSAYSALPALEAPSSSAPVSRYLQGLGTTAEQRKPLATVTEAGFPLHQDPSDDLFGHEDPTLGVMPLLTHRGFHRRVMRPQQLRALSRPGRGPMPPFITSHPLSRPFGVAQSSLAIREVAQLRARDPAARQLTSRKHAQPRLEQPAPKPENLPAGFEMPDKLPSPETAVGLLAQANRASERFANLSRAPQPASTSAAPAVLGMDPAMAGTAAEYIKDHPLIDPRAKSRPAAAAQRSLLPPQGTAAPTPPRPSGAATPPIAPKADADAPTTSTGAVQRLRKAAAEHELAGAAQPLSPPPPAQSPTVGNAAVAETMLRTDQANATQANPPAAAPVATVADQPAALPASVAPENAAAATDAASDGASSPTDLQQGKANKQRPGGKQRRRLRDMAEAARAEAELIEAAEAKAKEKADIEAAARTVAAAEAKAKADAEEKARLEAEAIARQAAEAAALKAADELLASEERAFEAAAKKKANKLQKKKAKGAALQLAANVEDKAGPSGANNVAVAPEAAAAAPQQLPPAEAAPATAKSKAKKKKKGQQAPNTLEEQAGPSSAPQGAAGITAGSRQPSDAAEQPVSPFGPSQAQALPTAASITASSSQAAPSAVSLPDWLPAAAPNGHVSGHYALQRQPSPAVRAPSRPYMPPEAASSDSADGWMVVNSHQRHAGPAVAHHPTADDAPAASFGEQPADAEEQEFEEEEKIGLAALEGYFPLRRRGVRAGKRHKKRYGGRDAAARNLAPSEYSDDDSDHTVSGHLMAGQLPRSPLAGQPDSWDYPGASVRGVGPPPGLPVADWPSIAAEHQARQSRHASLRQSHAQAAQAAQLDAAQRAVTAADLRRQAEAMSAQGASADAWPALQVSEPSASSSGVLPRDAAAAMAQQIVAESQHRDAAATLAAKPKPKARIRGVTRAPTAAEAAVAAAAAATSGLLDSIPAPAKASRKIAQGAGAAAGSAAQADAHTKPEQPAVLVPVPEVQLSTAEMIELLEAELEAEYCCPLTLDEFEDPVRAADGRAYERSAIQQWLQTHDTSPMTNEPMPHKHLIPDPELLNKLHVLNEKLAALIGE